MVEVTKRYICDICGAEGGKESYVNFMVHHNNVPSWITSTEVGDLCPQCADLWEEHKKTFIKRYKHEQ